MLVEFPETDPVELGMGWNSRTASKVQNVCIKFRPGQQKYQDQRLRFETITDNESLANALNVSVAAKFKTITGAGGSASAAFAKNAKFSSTSTNVAVVAEVYESPLYVMPLTGAQPDSALTMKDSGPKVDMSRFYGGNSVSFNDQMRQLAGSDLAQFYRQCGDSFVAVIHRGARLIGNITFAETSREEREQLQMSASGGASMWNVSGSLSTNMEKFNSSSRLNINFAQFGGGGGKFPLSRDGLLQAIERLPTESAQSPKPFTMVVQRYDSLPGWPAPIGDAELSDLAVIASVAWQLDTLQSYADEVLYTPGWLLKFDTTRAQVKGVYDEIVKERQNIRRDAIACNSGKRCNREKWENWSDIKYKVRFPLFGSFSTLKYSLGEDAVDEMIKALANARVAYWIEGPARIRCRNEGVCLTQGEIDRAKAVIQARVSDAIKAD